MVGHTHADALRISQHKNPLQSHKMNPRRSSPDPEVPCGIVHMYSYNKGKHVRGGMDNILPATKVNNQLSVTSPFGGPLS